MDVENEWCSWCFQRTAHTRIVTAGRFDRIRSPVHHCQGCGSPTRRCAACSKMACASPQVSHRLCATHRGEITSFESQSRLIADPCDYYGALFTSADTDIKRAIKKTALAAGAVVGTILVAAVVRRVVGGSIGRSLGRAGAAAHNSGLAFLGGGSIASGGGGIEAGSRRVNVALARSALYRVRNINHAFFSRVQDDFKVRLVRPGRDPALICINGFHNEETDEKASQLKDQEWLNGLGSAYSDRAIYRVVWPSKTIDITKQQLGKTALMTAGSIAMARFSMRASKANGSIAVAGPLAAGAFVSTAADFSWLTSLSNARRTANLLAELISRCDNRSFVLIGHSLGARVCVLALRRLAKRAIRHSRITDVHLMGGAIDRVNADYWEPIAKLIDGRCTNYHSDEDQVLKWLFRFGTGNVLAKPIGLYPLPSKPETERLLRSIDVTHVVKGHQQYHQNISQILLPTP